MRLSGFNATFIFKAPADAKLFIGRATHVFGVGCIGHDERVTVLISEKDYDPLVKLASTLGGELVVG